MMMRRVMGCLGGTLGIAAAAVLTGCQSGRYVGPPIRAEVSVMGVGFGLSILEPAAAGAMGALVVRYDDGKRPEGEDVEPSLEVSAEHLERLGGRK